ncbi:MAG: 23S rRNA (pseudouridine(1915)-N(3))-methyltransferase RlmH [Deltaproteobacteria bacterium]|nr:23S rRNA (pseudouridine(1915)-N(3))-methyltransferase RlmH [Deltaproteobacteria bacterium]
MKLKVIWTGKAGEGFIRQGVEHYQKRIAPFAKLELVELRPARHSGRNPQDALAREGEDILRRVGAEDTLIALDERGDTLDSLGFSRWMEGAGQTGSGSLAFVIGGAYGLDQAVLARSKLRLSLSRFTFPHQLVRVILLEQIYRALTLSAGHGYHHGE